jgi:phosphatidylglycerol---prolipoprotein diacylglyceryl transferase
MLANLAVPLWSIDPVALQIGPYFGFGPILVRWYGLAYMAGLLLGWLYIKHLLDTPRLWPASIAPFVALRADDLLLFMTAGVILGGRLGSVLFYEPGIYLKDPIQILYVWEGGMAFHGALLGTGFAIWLFSRFYKVSTLSTMDLCAASVPLGLFFGRLANFVNGELWGRPTSVPWSMVFPKAGAEARHPSQLYEAALEGLLLFLVLRFLTHHRDALKQPGRVTGVFLVGYGVARSFCEFFREPDATHAFTRGILTPGITYSIPMIALGAWLIWRAGGRAESTVATKP